jgi:uncharacterized protein (TIGR02466 family)
MNSEIKSLFSIPVSVTNNFLSKNQCLDIRNYFLSKNNLNKHLLLEGEGLTSYAEDSDFLGEISSRIPSCSKVKHDLELLMYDYSFNTGMIHRVIDRSWANIQKRNSTLKPHTHPCSIFTGALYVSLSSPVSPLVLNNPNPFIHYTAISKYTKFTQTKFEIMPAEGMVVLFPSWIIHESSLNRSEERIVISFNSGMR